MNKIPASLRSDFSDCRFASEQVPLCFGIRADFIGILSEAGVMRDIRRHLLNERGMDRARAHTQGYWKYGAVNHPDNDRGQDVG